MAPVLHPLTLTFKARHPWIVDRGIDPTLQTLAAAEPVPRHKAKGSCSFDTALMTEGDDSQVGVPFNVEGFEEDEELAPGEFIGRYVIIEVLGQGGMGVVYSAYDSDLHRRLAIKLLRTINVGTRATEGHQRLIREAQALAGLTHPNVITVHDVGEHERQVFVAMELVDGVTLREYCEANSDDWNKVLEVYLQGGRGLAAAHAAGLIHRDFKPENVLVGDDGRVRVLDFGLARAASYTHPDTDENQEQREDVSRPLGSHGPRRSGSSLTRTGAIMGTPAYMSPEQHLGLDTDPRTDQFSFCVALYEGLAGQRPFPGATAVAIADSVLKGGPQVAPSRTHVPAKVWKAIERGLSREVDQRWPTMDALLGELELALHSGTSSRWQVFAGVAVLGVVLGTAFTGAGRPGVAEVAAAVRDCSLAAAPVDERWNPQRADALEQAFTAVGPGLPAEAGKRTREVLDGYADALRSAHLERCEEERQGAEVSAAMLHQSACLQERSEELEMLVAALSEPTAATVRSSVPAALSLTPVARCADADMISSVQSAAPELRDAVAKNRHALASAAALSRSGRFDDAKLALSQVVGQCREVEFVPLLSEALLEYGRVLASTQDPMAESVLREAVSKAESVRYDATVVEASTALVELVGIHAAHHAQGEQWADRAGDVLARMPEEPSLRSRLDTARGRLELSAGRISAAIEAHQSALKSANAILPVDPLRVAEARSNLGDAQTEAGDYAAAIESFSKALIELESQLGPDHPGLAPTLNGLGNVYDALGRLPHALGQLQRALDLREAAFGPDHPEVAGTRINLARVLLDMGELKEARSQLLRAEQAFEAAFGRAHPGVGLALEVLSRLEEQEGNLEGALTHLARALAIQESSAAADHLHRGALLTHLGELLHKKGESAKAVARLEQANALLDVDDAPPAARASTKLALARVLLEEKVDRTRARALAFEARALFSRAHGPNSPTLAAVDEFLAAAQ